jgi:hypothetical protein
MPQIVEPNQEAILEHLVTPFTLDLFDLHKSSGFAGLKPCPMDRGSTAAFRAWE